MKRAKKFYETVLKTGISEEKIGGARMGFIIYNREGVSAAIVKGENYRPTSAGVKIYLTVEAI